ncbi:MAG: U32 family peptidase [Synechococcaceae cyanobacterium SM2_3_1]|nr:U32 family peptidase [Synechococcaceae cyanobacterium SM2_3_1]
MNSELLTRTSGFRLPFLLAPAGNWESAQAAVENGADAIYFGLEQFNARMRADNFTEADLPELMAFLHSRGVKGYVTLNTLIFPDELAQAEKLIRSMITAGVDAVIVQDVGICRLIRHLSPDLPIHASTQMTVTSALGVEFARDLGCDLVVLARECSIKDINKIQNQLCKQGIALPLEVFVHGALCVAYSGQCLTSESLGGRSANRGECAQACRMPYDLIVDGEEFSLGDRRYLLSPQDLAGIEVLPELVQAGVACLKIEGRLKSPEYVATITRVYRQALDRVAEQDRYRVSAQEHYELEMSFSRGLYSGWFRGINNQELVHARFGKKRGVYLGQVTRVQKDQVALRVEAPVKPGDGVVFDGGHPDQKEEGGRIYHLDRQGQETLLKFGKGDLNFRRIHVGDRVWKTSDPEWEKQARQSYTGEQPRFHRPLDMEVHGSVDQPLTLIVRDEEGHQVKVVSDLLLTTAHTRPLDQERLEEQLGRLGQTPFFLRRLQNHLQGHLMLPVKELNRLRRQAVEPLLHQRSQSRPWRLNPSASCQDLLPTLPTSAATQPPQLLVLVRTMNQLKAAQQAEIATLYCEFEDPRAYRQAVALVRDQPTTPDQTLWVTPPRISKPGEHWILEQVHSAGADGYLVRNYDQLLAWQGERCIGDFSLNVANPITASFFKQRGLERLTASYDLNIQQLESLLQSTPAHWFEITIHQHMPMFHMEHCVFCAFLSEGTDYTNCGRPCEIHQVQLRDRVGMTHTLQADAGCRNTVFNGLAQTGAEYVDRLIHLGVRYFRVEFMQESPAEVTRTLKCYQQLLKGEISGSRLWRELQLLSQLGVTRGPLEEASAR